MKRIQFFCFCRRTHAQNEHEFTFLEAIKVHMTRMPSFCKLKMLRHAQIQIVVSKVFQQTAVPFFYKRERYTKFLLNQNSFPKKWGQALCACVLLQTKKIAFVLKAFLNMQKKPLMFSGRYLDWKTSNSSFFYACKKLNACFLSFCNLQKITIIFFVLLARKTLKSCF